MINHNNQIQTNSDPSLSYNRDTWLVVAACVIFCLFVCFCKEIVKTTTTKKKPSGYKTIDYKTHVFFEGP